MQKKKKLQVVAGPELQCSCVALQRLLVIKSLFQVSVIIKAIASEASQAVGEIASGIFLIVAQCK